MCLQGDIHWGKKREVVWELEGMVKIFTTTTVLVLGEKYTNPLLYRVR